MRQEIIALALAVGVMAGPSAALEKADAWRRRTRSWTA